LMNLWYRLSPIIARYVLYSSIGMFCL